MIRKEIGKRAYLSDLDSKKLIQKITYIFETEVDIPRIRHGKKQTFETLINEEELLLAKFLRNERKEWKTRLNI
mgnify:CR=1 FL=1